MEFRSRFNYNLRYGVQPVDAYARCPNCFPRHEINRSKAETELFEFVKRLDPECV